MIIEFFKDGVYEAVPMAYNELLELPNLLTAKYRIKVGNYVITPLDLENELPIHNNRIFRNFNLYDRIGLNPYTGLTLAGEMQKVIDGNQSPDFKVGVLSTMIEHLKVLSSNTLHMIDVRVAAALTHFDLRYSNGVTIQATESEIMNVAIGIKENSLEATLFFCNFAEKLASFTPLSSQSIPVHLLTTTETRLKNIKSSRTLTDTPLNKKRKKI